LERLQEPPEAQPQAQRQEPLQARPQKRPQKLLKALLLLLAPLRELLQAQLLVQLQLQLLARPARPSLLLVHSPKAQSREQPLPQAQPSRQMHCRLRMDPPHYQMLHHH
jgi:hypothetical protein